MGVVYKVEDTNLGRTVALKFLAPHLLRSDDARKRFKREARAAAALDHPNICTVHEIDEADGKTFIALAFLEGQTLTEKIAQGPFPLNEVLSVGLQLTEGLGAAHDHGVVHRDMKPDNVMLIAGTRGLAKIMDFGLAQLSGTSKVTRDGTTLGTMAYMSPEQAEGGEVDSRSDLWSLGVVLYEMIAGRPPFLGEFDQAVVYSILNEQPEPLTAVRTGVPPELERIVNKCLAKEAAAGYQHADDLCVDLESLRKVTDHGTSRVLPPTQGPAAGRSKWWLPAGVAAALALAGGLWFSQAFRTSSGTSPAESGDPSVAIMPFVNASGDAEFEYFADGMTDELINALSNVEGLKVVARSSVFRFKGEKYEIKDVASQLGVDNVLEGAVRREGERLRITAQLISAGDGFELWSQRFDRRMEAVFDIQDEVSAEIVKHLRVELGGTREVVAIKRPTNNVQAYDSCLRGEFEYFKLSGAGAANSIPYFEEAIRLDPNFARAHAGLARAYTNLAVFGARQSAEVATKARELVARALELDDSEARSHAAAAYVARFIDWDWEAAEKSYRRALDLNPPDAETRGSYANYLGSIGRVEEAIAEAERALRSNPLSASVNRRLTFAYLQARRFEDGLRLAQRTMDLAPRHLNAYWDMSNALIGLGRVDEAVEIAEKAASLAPDSAGTHWYVGYAYGRAGRRSKALAVAQELERWRERDYYSALMIAHVYVGIEDRESFFKWMEIAFRERDPQLVMIKYYQIFDKVRDDPRFQDIVRRMKFPD